jgi:archaellum component FlaC
VAGSDPNRWPDCSQNKWPDSISARKEVLGMIETALKPIHHKLREINRRLETLDDQNKNLKGVTKEIDELRDQVHAIEKHLGLKKKIAA